LPEVKIPTILVDSSQFEKTVCLPRKRNSANPQEGAGIVVVVLVLAVVVIEEVAVLVAVVVDVADGLPRVVAEVAAVVLAVGSATPRRAARLASAIPCHIASPCSAASSLTYPSLVLRTCSGSVGQTDTHTF
jgi:hypothetical protein